MSDLIQEVKDTIEKYEANRSPGEWCTADDAIQNNSVEWMKQLIDRVETAERQREEANKAILKTIEELMFVPAEIEKLKKQLSEAVKALEMYAKESNWGSNIHGCSKIFHGCDEGYEPAAITLKRIKGAAQAEGHQSTESTQAQAGGRQGSGGSHE